MEHNLKEKIIKSVNTIKSKIKQMKNKEDETNLHINRVLKPLTDPLKEMVELGKCNFNIENDTKAEEVNNYSMSNNSQVSCYADFESDSNESIKTVDTYKENDNNDKQEMKTPTRDEQYVTNLDTPILSMIAKENLLDDVNNLNVPFGIRTEKNKLMIGNIPVIIRLSDRSSKPSISMISIGNTDYNMTKGLKELLLKKKPDIDLVSEQDKLVYKEILHNTHAHKRDFNSTGQIKGDKGMKYCNIIKPLFYESDNLIDNDIADKKCNMKRGGNIMKTTKKTYKKNTDFIYWDDPNELIERLMLLTASKDAGNTNHDNEIISIIEELKEAGIIKE